MGRLSPMRRWLRYFNRRCRRWMGWIWQQEGSPGQRARGLAAGIFCGCFPFFGLQTLLGIALASVVRGNHLLAAAGTWISNPFTYLPLYWFNYHVGDVLLRGGEPPAAVNVNKASILYQGWSFTSRLLLGSSLVGLVLSLGLGVLAWRLFRWQPRNDHRMQTGRHLEDEVLARHDVMDQP